MLLLLNTQGDANQFSYKASGKILDHSSIYTCTLTVIYGIWEQMQSLSSMQEFTPNTEH